MMSEEREWCDWFLLPSEGSYLRDDERYYYRLSLLIPSIGLLSSWLSWNNQSLFSWHYPLFWSIILMLVSICLTLNHFQCHLISFLNYAMATVAWFWHGFFLLVENSEKDMNHLCNIIKENKYLEFLFCIWPSGALWQALRRDGFCLIIAICLILVFHFRPAPPPLFISIPFDGRPLDSLSALNPRHDRMRSQRKRRRCRSPYVIHYVIRRMGQIRYRRRRR